MVKHTVVSLMTLEIEELGPKGDGICRGPKGAVYVERALPGDRVKVRVRKDSEGIARGEIIEIIEPSPYRQKAPCPHYDRCGNCTLQHLQENAYRAWKVEMVKEALRKKHLRPDRFLEPVFLGDKNRRRATFTVRKDRGKTIVGYYARRSQEVTDIDSCLVLHPRLFAVRDKLAALATKETMDIFLQLVDNSIDMLMTGHADLKKVKEFDATRVSVRADYHSPIKNVKQKSPITATFGKLKVALPPGAFLQPTLEGEQHLVSSVLSALPKEGAFADLFSGCGTFSGAMLARGSVDAYESDSLAVKSLAKSVGPLRLKVHRRDLFRRPLTREELKRYDAVVFDPPRAGCAEQVRAMASSRVPICIGVSCNPATFARDARTLCDGGYRLQSVQFVDQFVYSHHVEVVGVFTKRR